MLRRSKETVADFLEYDEDSYSAPVEPGPPPELDGFEAADPTQADERSTRCVGAAAPVAPGPPLTPIRGPDLVDVYADLAEPEEQLGPSEPAPVEGWRTRRPSMSRLSLPRRWLPSPMQPSVQTTATLSLPAVGAPVQSCGRTIALAAIGGTVCTLALLLALTVGRGTPDRPHSLVAKVAPPPQPASKEVSHPRLAEPAERSRAAARERRRGRAGRASRRRAAKRKQRRRRRAAPRVASRPVPRRTEVRDAPPTPAQLSRPRPISPPPAAPRSVAEAEFGIEGP